MLFQETAFPLTLSCKCSNIILIPLIFLELQMSPAAHVSSCPLTQLVSVARSPLLCSTQTHHTFRVYCSPSAKPSTYLFIYFPKRMHIKDMWWNRDTQSLKLEFPIPAKVVFGDLNINTRLSP